MNILLANHRSARSLGEFHNFPLGLAYVSAALKHSGLKVSTVNLNLSRESIEHCLADILTGHQTDIFITGGISIFFNEIKSLVEAVKEIRPGVMVIIGGGMVSSEPELSLVSLGADFAVVGEGEVTAVELVKAIINEQDLSAIKGIVYRDEQGRIVQTPPREPIMDLDALPWPDYEGFGLPTHLSYQRPSDGLYCYAADHPRMIHVVSSRSCPFDCTFCFHPLGKRYRQRSIDNFIQEISMLVDRYGVNTVMIHDELFSYNAQRLADFCQKVQPLNIKWTCQMRVDLLDDLLLQTLKDAGCFQLLYGIESASDKILQSMKKNTKIAQVEKSLAMTYNAGIGIQGNFILGDPAETLETARETIGWWQSHAQYQLNMVPVIPYPGTEIYVHALKHGIIKDRLGFLEAGCPPVNLTEMPDRRYWGIIAKASHTCFIDNGCDAKLDSVTMEKVDALQRSSVTIDLVCPHCEKTVRYGNFNLAPLEKHYQVRQLHCRSCNQKFNITIPPLTNIGWEEADYARAVRRVGWKGLLRRCKTAIKTILPRSIVTARALAGRKARNESYRKGPLLVGDLHPFPDEYLAHLNEVWIKIRPRPLIRKFGASFFDWT